MGSQLQRQTHRHGLGFEQHTRPQSSARWAIELAGYLALPRDEVQVRAKGRVQNVRRKCLDLVAGHAHEGHLEAQQRRTGRRCAGA